jgi:hypothetical protein
MVRPVKSFDAILNAVVMELQRTQGAKVKLTLEIAAEAPGGFPDGEVGVVRDNARQLKVKPNPPGLRIKTPPRSELPLIGEHGGRGRPPKHDPVVTIWSPRRTPI